MLSPTFAVVFLASFLTCAVITAGVIVIGRYEMRGREECGLFHELRGRYPSLDGPSIPI
jgi:hypothetical protein